ncbi:jg22376, partial [Pararge aegeria aegeria]
ITDSPLCRACMEADETPTHVLIRCRGVAEQRAAYLGSPASLPEVLGDLGGLLSFWELARLAAVTQRGAVPVALRTTEGSGRPNDRTIILGTLNRSLALLSKKAPEGRADMSLESLKETLASVLLEMR